MLEGKGVSTATLVGGAAADAAADAAGAVVAPAGGAGGTGGTPAQNDEETPAAAAARQQMQEMLETERSERLAMEEQLQALKAKLLHSGDADSHVQGPSLLAAGNAAAEHQAAVSRRQRDEMEEEERLYFDEEFDDLSKEVAAKSKKLKALRKKHKSLVADQKERESEFHLIGVGLMETVRSVTIDLSLYRTISNAHVDAEVLLECEVKSVYDDEGEIWLLPDSVAAPAPQGPEARQRGRVRNGLNTPTESTSTQPLPTMGLEPVSKLNGLNDVSSGAVVETPSIDLGALAAMNQGMDDVRERLVLQTTQQQQPPPIEFERPKSRGGTLAGGRPKSRGADSLSSPSAAVVRGVTTAGDGPAQQGNKSAAERQQASANRVVQKANSAANKATAMLPSLGEQTEQKAKQLMGTSTYSTHDASRAVHTAPPLARRNELIKLWGASPTQQVATSELMEGRRVAGILAAKLQLAPLSGGTPDIAASALTNDAKTLSDLQADTRAAALLRADRVRWEMRSGAADGEEMRQLRERNLRAEEELAAATVENAWLREELRREKERQKTENWEVALRMLKEQEEHSGAAATVSAITL